MIVSRVQDVTHGNQTEQQHSWRQKKIEVDHERT
jgi:hypothetical protein